MKQKLSLLTLIFATIVSVLSLQSCAADEPAVPTYANYTIATVLIDPGDYTYQEADALVASLNQITATVKLEQKTEADARAAFNTFIDKMAKEMENTTANKEITLRFVLYRQPNDQIVVFKTLYITPQGSNIMMPGYGILYKI